MNMRYLLLPAALGALTMMVGIDPPILERATAVRAAEAQQMGRQPWGSPRNKSLAAQFQNLEDVADRGAARINQQITTYHSSSTSIGNLTEINQILNGSAQGSLDYIANQTSSGNQGSSATTDTTTSGSGPAGGSSERGASSARR